MKEMIRSYHMFIPKRPIIIRVFLYCLYPLFVVLFYRDVQSEDYNLFGFLVAGMTYFFIELSMDAIIFSGVATRKGCTTAYLQSSCKGKCLIKKAIIADCIRKFFTLAVIYIVLLLWAVFYKGEIITLPQGINILTMLFVFYNLQGIGNLLGRLTANVLVRFFIVGMMTMQSFVVIAYSIAVSTENLLVCLIFAMLAVVISWGLVATVMGQVEKSYVDKEAIYEGA